VRTPNASQRLTFLKGVRPEMAVRSIPARLESADPEGKWQILNASVNGIKLAIGGK